MTTEPPVSFRKKLQNKIAELTIERDRAWDERMTYGQALAHYAQCGMSPAQIDVHALTHLQQQHVPLREICRRLQWLKKITRSKKRSDSDLFLLYLRGPED